MKVYNLACQLDHRFEGWFASEGDYLAQQDKGILACPVCDSAQITRMPSAPHIGKSSSTELSVPKLEADNVSSGSDGGVVALAKSDHSQLEAQVQAAFLKGMRELMVRSEDVGDSFADEARKMHYKESPERSIRGQASLDEAEALREEGIDVLSMPMIPLLKNTLQ